jgi:hypothetical protein
VVAMVAMGDVVGEKKMKFIQFVAIFWLSKQGHTMIDFEAMNLLFEFLKVKHTLKKHWSDSVGWEITKFMHNIVFITIKIINVHVAIKVFCC